MKHKKSNIPISILVIGVFLVCALIIVTFLISKAKTRETFSGVDLIEKMNSQVEVYQATGDLSGDVITNSDGKKVFYQERIDEGFWFWEEDRVVFSVQRRLDSLVAP